MLDEKFREELLERAVAEIIVKEELIERLNSGRQLRLKQGFDPSKPTLHIGHAVGLRKLRRFQELGHQVVLIVGDWTAQIGDPSGRDESRTMLSAEQVKQNAATYMEQFFRVVDRSRTEVRWQSEWFGKFTLSDVFNLTSRFTLGQMMQHETFRKRWEEGNPLTIMEIMYPILQAYDSVAVHADVEFGGTDQKFNILTGRELQAMLGQPPQDVYLVDLLPGTDGRKMSKSFGNSIDLNDPPDQMYGKVMSLSDEFIIPYFVMATDVPMPEIKEMERAMAAGSVNPRDLKMRLAREIVTMFYGPAATAAETEFVRVFRQRELPSEVPEYHVTGPGPFNIVDLLVQAQLVSSKSEARRAITQSGVRVNGERVESIEATFLIHDGMIVQVGKRRFVRFRLSDNA